MFGVELTLPTQALRRGRAVPLEIDFVEGRYWSDGQAAASFAALPGVTFSRSGPGVGRASSGSLVTFGTAVPRITDLGLLLEGARTNLLLRSQTFDNAYWTKGRASVTADVATAPDGTLSADKLTETTDNETHVVFNNITALAAGTTYTASVYLKAAERTWAWVSNFGIGVWGTTRGVFVNLATGELGNAFGSPSAVSSEAAGDGWWRVSFSAATSGSGNAGMQVGTAVANGTAPPLFAGTAGSGILIWQFDLQAGSSPASPVPTTAAASTRAADSAAVLIPANATTYEAVYGPTNAVLTGPVTPGATFDLLVGRPWVGWGSELKRLVIR